MEGQPLSWVQPSKLCGLPLPAADQPVVQALCLPERYLITPEPEPGRDDAWMCALQQAIASGVPMLQLRAVTLSVAAYRRLAESVLHRVRAAGGSTRVLLNGDPRLALELGADGVHLNARRLARLRRRPLPDHQLVGASCHGALELESAARLGADFAVLGPVNATATHPGAPALGWPVFGELTAAARIPVFALGGVGAGDLDTAWAAGAQGIAAIRALWPTGVADS
jgi:8-oxo-dGTP diphosphatase